MTLSEIRKDISNSPNKEWFKELSVPFDFQYINIEYSFTGFSSIYKFVSDQKKGWEKLAGEIPSELSASVKYFNSIHDQMISLMTSYKNSDINTLDHNWRRIRDYITGRPHGISLPYNVPESDFLIKLHKERPEVIHGAFAFFSNQIITNRFNDRNYLEGLISSYEFSFKDSSQILSRRTSEKGSITKIRNDFQRYLTESEKVNIEYLEKSLADFETNSQVIEELKSASEILFNEWFDKKKAELTSLTLKYEEDLMFRKPAEYWKTRGNELSKKGKFYSIILAITVFLGAAALFFLLWLTPEGILLNFIDNPLLSIKWSLILVTFLSFLAFGVRVFSKIVFSSLHLARDAEERYTLTYFYLALLNDESVTKEDRHLILQSLFSRSDTGLLKEDSTPVLPNDINNIFTGNRSV